VNGAALAVPATGIEAAGASRLEVRSLQKSYGKRQVVKDVSLSVLNGEVVGLLGPNGAGKTTSFYMIVGLVRADAGDISIDGQRIDSMPIHRRSRLGLSYLPQEASIFRKLTVSDNVRAVLELQHDSAGQPLDKAEIDRAPERPAAGPAGGAPVRLAGARAVGRRAPARGDRPRAGHPAALHPAGRAVCRHRPDRGDRDPAHRRLPQVARHRRADHRPQRARDPGHL
jgi:ABC-type sugar transport system ATPase subunit